MSRDMFDIVRRGAVSLTYVIYKYGEDQYDVRLSNGDEGPELFESIEDAEAWVEAAYS